MVNTHNNHNNSNSNIINVNSPSPIISSDNMINSPYSGITSDSAGNNINNNNAEAFNTNNNNNVSSDPLPPIWTWESRNIIPPPHSK